MNSPKHLKASIPFRAVAVLACALAVSGCATTPQASLPLTLKLGGDPGVTVQVISSLPDVPPQVATVPGELQFHGRAYELRCIHGPQAGRLQLIAARGGMQISTGDTLRPGEVTVFKVRPDEIAVGPGSTEK